MSENNRKDEERSLTERMQDSRERIEDKYSRRRRRTEQLQLADRLAQAAGRVGAGLAAGRAGVPVRGLTPSYQADWVGRLGRLDEAEARELSGLDRPRPKTLEDRVAERRAMLELEREFEGQEAPEKEEMPASETYRNAMIQQFPFLRDTPDVEKLTEKQLKDIVAQGTKEGVRKARSYAVRMDESNEMLNDLEEEAKIDPTSLRVTATEDILPEFAKNWVLTPDERAYFAAKEGFITGILRLESGAAISNDEFRRYNKVYFPVFGDSEDTLDWKRQMRYSAIGAMRGIEDPRARQMKLQRHARTEAAKRRRAVAEEALADPNASPEVKANARRALGEARVEERVEKKRDSMLDRLLGIFRGGDDSE